MEECKMKKNKRTITEKCYAGIAASAKSTKHKFKYIFTANNKRALQYFLKRLDSNTQWDDKEFKKVLIFEDKC